MVGAWAGAASITGRRVAIDIDEPSVFAATGMNVRKGVLQRLLTGRNAKGQTYQLAIVELDQEIRWDSNRFEVVSLRVRHAGREISDLSVQRYLGVSISGWERWILGCSQDDPRISSRMGSRYLGYGTARLVD
jgi:hypothetical protein